MKTRTIILTLSEEDYDLLIPNMDKIPDLVRWTLDLLNLDVERFTRLSNLFAKLNRVNKTAKELEKLREKPRVVKGKKHYQRKKAGKRKANNAHKVIRLPKRD